MSTLLRKLSKALLGAAFVGLGIWALFRFNYEVPILMYHRVNNPNDTSSLNVSLATFERQMEFLKVHRYNVMRVEDIIELVKAKKPIPPKTVAITFDDGFMDNFTYAFPILKKMDFPATIFMITRNINEEGWLTEEDLRILEEGGVSIGSHTVTHAHLPDHTDTDIEFELRESKKRLEKILGHPVNILSYPAGGFTGLSRAKAIEAGYTGALSTNRGLPRHDPYAMHRVKITESGGSLTSFWLKTSGFYHLGKKRPRVDSAGSARSTGYYGA